MKKTIRVFAIYATLALLPVFANVIELKAQTPAASGAQGQCIDDNKAAWYADFTKYRTSDATKAYDPAKQYLAACPAEEGPIPNYLRKWVAAYDREARKIKLENLFINLRKYAEATPVAREVLADDPDSLLAHIALGYGGYVIAVNTKNESGNAEAINYTKKSIQLIGSGKTIEFVAPAKPMEDWLPFKSKEDALGYLHYSLGYLERTSNPANALVNYIKAARFESDMKKNSQTYVFIAAAYESEYAKQSADYLVYKDKDETPESKLAVANINQLVDRIVDALARAVAVAGTDAAGQASKVKWLERLTELYKFRNGSETGLPEMIASVLSRPLPPVPTPLTELPATTPTTSTTPSSGSTSAGGSTAAPGTSSAPAANKAPTTTAAPPAATTMVKPATTAPQTASTKPAAKPKTRNNHRRH